VLYKPPSDLLTVASSISHKGFGTMRMMQTTRRTFISGISLQLGSVVDLVELQQSGFSQNAISRLRDRGLDRFLRESGDPADVWSACASASMSEAGISPESIDLVLISNLSNFHEAGLRTLQRIGLGRSKLIGLSLLDCAACTAAITVASALAIDGSRVLTIVPWAGVDSNRLGPNGDTLFGDGTVSLIVSDQEGEFEILATENWTDPGLIDLDRNHSQKANYLLTSLDNLQRTKDRAMRKAGVEHASLRAAFCTNGNSVFQEAIAMATSTGRILFRDPLTRFGHVLACDELLGLKTYVEEKPTCNGDVFLLLAWAPYAASACIVRRCVSGFDSNRASAQIPRE
jgi:3-oxoacyl-[acyl-carrier-protein] synthase III